MLNHCGLFASSRASHRPCLAVIYSSATDLVIESLTVTWLSGPSHVQHRWTSFIFASGSLLERCSLYNIHKSGYKKDEFDHG
jgi:hypothetical protein